MQPLDKVLVPNWRDGHRFATTWVAAFWGAFGGALCLLPIFITLDNALLLGPVMIFMSITYAVARFTRQPGCEQ